MNDGLHVEVLFNKSWKICEEFKRITTVSLESTFLAKLDQCTPKLMALTQSKGGAAGLKMRHIKDMLLEDNTVERRREVAIRYLIVYLGEKEEELFKQYSDVEELDTDLLMQVMKIAIIGDRATIVVEGTKVLQRTHETNLTFHAPDLTRDVSPIHLGLVL
ncbi:hypothetical protein D5F01_LYC02387 [Larimichthys crocea]|uniref:Uncharacterized protein n=1 Tax=Larimichthys crocea TaxID=215358 RepID=A0A6G0J2D1_LARCR|nr:hypothetical protein D5F01_LYC02387 [Larimichthys crocea]